MYSYDDLAMEDMFIEIASRNDNEMSIDEIARGKEVINRIIRKKERGDI